VRYYVQFTAGTAGLVRDALAARLDRLTIGYADDSAMILDSVTTPATVAAIPFLKNAFVVVAATERGDLAKSVVRLGHGLRRNQFPSLSERSDRFRLMAHLDGALVPIEPRARAGLERVVARHTGARVEPRGMGQEYWVIGRQGMPELLFAARLPKPPRTPTAKGAIASELAAMLVAASQPTAEDRFLDPFGGSGALVVARAALPARSLAYSDLDLERHRRALTAQLPGRLRVRLLAEDALTLPSIADGTVDVIVTDPPWGEHEDLGGPFGDFAAAIGESFARVLHPARGRYVVLVNRRNAEVMADALAAAGVRATARHDILVNGHPATVLIGRMRAQSASAATARR
jgi:predicted RNA methylase